MLGNKERLSSDAKTGKVSTHRFRRTAVLIIVLIMITGTLIFIAIKAFTGSWVPLKESRNSTHNKKKIKIVSFTTDTLDTAAKLIVKGNQFRINTKKKLPNEHFKVKIANEFPQDGRYHAEIKKITSYPFIFIQQQPTLQNNFELRVQILNNQNTFASDDPISFDIYAAPTPKYKHQYNIVIITLDTLRSDRLGCYGYTRPTSPNLDAFTKQAVLYKNAFSTSSFTPPSHASLFTAKYVGDHGLLSWNKLPDKEVTLAEKLKGCGFVTAAITNLHLLSRHNLEQGFDLCDEEESRDGREIIKNAIRFIRVPHNSPFLLWLHLFDVHRPYGRHEDWTRRFNENGRNGAGDVERHYNLWKHKNKKGGFNLEDSGLNDEDLQFITDRYDAGIAYTDWLLKKVFDELNTSSRLKDTMIIITSDHGENLLEYQECLFSHDPFLYSVVTRIPLLIRYPGAMGGGQTIDTLVSLIDLAPTVLDVIGLPAPKSFKTGKSLVPLLTDEKNWPPRQLFMECWGHKKLTAIRSENQLVIHDIKRGKTNFFDLVNDPEELQPFRKPQNNTASLLYDSLIEFSHRKNIHKKEPKLDQETIQRLRSLGYLY